MLLVFVLCLMLSEASSWFSTRRRRAGRIQHYPIRRRQIIRRIPRVPCWRPYRLGRVNTCRRRTPPVTSRRRRRRYCAVVYCSWSYWGSWSACSRSCGGIGVQTRAKFVNMPRCGGKPCRGVTPIQTRICYNHARCPVHCAWASWGSWSSCSSTCGGGNHHRSRAHAVEARYGGNQCTGLSRMEESCSTQCCPANCVWDEWVHWGQCSVTCGEGTQLRRRGETVVQSCGGSHCVGESIERKGCALGCCPVNCTWGHWGDWSDCSHTCGDGSQSRDRLRSVLDVCGGIGCAGPDEETRSCNDQCCATDCRWGSWGQWGACSKSCNVGTHSRTRNIAVETSCGGEDCLGDDSDTEPCNEFCCEEHCYWDEWIEWGKCTKSCGGGIQPRHRSVRIDHACKIQRCPGLYNETRSCNEECCPVDCEHSLWTEWSDCSLLRGGHGVQQRHRNITTEMECGGKLCQDKLKEERACNRFCFNGGQLDGGICSCDIGWEGRCCEEDINECESSGSCPENSVCFNTRASYECVCNHNFTKQGDICIPMTACHWGTHDCHEKAQCVSVGRNYMCECEPGFMGSGTSCSDVDECELESIEIDRLIKTGLDYEDLASGSGGLPTPLCHENATCKNTYGSFVCQCDNGYEGNGTVCRDIDECSLPEMVKRFSGRSPSPGTLSDSPLELSGSGSGDGEASEDEETFEVCSEYATCKNVPGGYECSCDIGYDGDGINCYDIDECADEGRSICPLLNQICVNEQGGYACICEKGFVLKDGECKEPEPGSTG